MKKTILIMLALLLACGTNAQVVRSGSTQRVIKVHKSKKDHRLDNNTIGLYMGPAIDNRAYRLIHLNGDPYFGYCAGINYQHKTSLHSRIDFQFGLGLYNNYEAKNIINMSCTYQGLWNIMGGWNCYAGAGASIGYGRIRRWEGLDLGVQGVVGTEYRFQAPISVSFEVRPWMHSVELDQEILSLQFNFGLRYTF